MNVHRYGTVAAAALAVSALSVPAAHADGSVVLSCQGHTSQTYTPGLTLNARSTEIRTLGSYDSCTGGGTVVSGTYALDYSVVASCTATSPVTSGSITITWNTGEVSRYSGTFAVERPVGQTVLTGAGTITAGKFLGATVNQTAAFPAPDLAACTTDTGVTSADGVVALTLTSLLQ